MGLFFTRGLRSIRRVGQHKHDNLVNTSEFCPNFGTAPHDLFTFNGAQAQKLPRRSWVLCPTRRLCPFPPVRHRISQKPLCRYWLLHPTMRLFHFLRVCSRRFTSSGNLLHLYHAPAHHRVSPWTTSPRKLFGPRPTQRALSHMRICFHYTSTSH
jgi:hypothetical protein